MQLESHIAVKQKKKKPISVLNLRISSMKNNSFIILIHMIYQISCHRQHMIPGPGCGGVDTQITTMKNLPKDFEDLKKLKCVLTPDTEGFRRWQMTNSSKYNVYFEVLSS